MLSTSISRIVKISVAVLPCANKERITDLDIITKERESLCVLGGVYLMTPTPVGSMILRSRTRQS